MASRGAARAVLADRRQGDPRTKLSREQVVQAAWQLLEEEGLEGFTIRRLASELGVAPMTIYGYFADKESLLDAVIEDGSKRLSLPGGSGPWRARLRGLFVELYRVLSAYPFVVEMRRRRSLMTPGVLRFTEAALEVLIEAGFSIDEAARAFRPLFVYTFGSAAFNPGEEEIELSRRRGLGVIAALPREEYPAVTEAAFPLAATLAGEEPFEYGLDRLLDGLEAQLATKAPSTQ
jgi:AcrR family transcriptional regulator